MSKNAQNSISGVYQFCKKKTRENEKGFSKLYVATERTSMDVDLYKEEAIIAQKVQVFLLVVDVAKSDQNKTKIYIQAIQEIWCSQGYNL